jgi:Uma2 family endonuclease
MKTLIKKPPEPTEKNEIIYPDSDGKPMSDNTKQFNWIVKIKENLERMYSNDPNVFIAGDLLWYPIEGDNKTRTAPDAMVVFGRPKGDRGSYRTWEEDNITPHVVFEILSPGNTKNEMERKFYFYERYGVEEYYLYDPDHCVLKGWIRSGEHFQPVDQMHNWVSPRLKIRFDMSGEEVEIFRPDGESFLSTVELGQLVLYERQRAEKERMRAEEERQEAEKERLRAEEAIQRVQMLEKRMDNIVTQLQKLGIKLDSM